jgi:hypothetical protein
LFINELAHLFNVVQNVTVSALNSFIIAFFQASQTIFTSYNKTLTMANLDVTNDSGSSLQLVERTALDCIFETKVPLDRDSSTAGAILQFNDGVTLRETF